MTVANKQTNRFHISTHANTLSYTPHSTHCLSKNDLMRKPRVGAWEYLEQNLNGGMVVDRSSSIYVGDGAGRVPPVVKKKDFGPGDLLFSLNLGTQFNTPEQFFLDHVNGGYSLNFPFDPRQLGLNPVPLPSDAVTQAGPVEIVICIGSPG
jgi:bifunctional polynucleotide phosphatase/kinase